MIIWAKDNEDLIYSLIQTLENSYFYNILKNIKLERLVLIESNLGEIIKFSCNLDQESMEFKKLWDLIISHNIRSMFPQGKQFLQVSINAIKKYHTKHNNFNNFNVNFFHQINNIFKNF